MARLAVLTLLAVLPAGGAAQRGDWPMPAKDYAATRYSDLTEITGANAGRLRPVWSFSTGVLGGHEGQPLVEKLQDRKSTRLNSSHLVISYAVFCLKKKNHELVNVNA